VVRAVWRSFYDDDGGSDISANTLMQERRGAADAAGRSQFVTHSAAIVAIVVISLMLAVATPSGLSSAGQDDRSSAASIARLPYTDAGVDIAAATVEADEPTSSCGPLEHTVWYALDLEGDVPLSMRIAPLLDNGASTDVAFAAWEVRSDGTLGEIGCADERSVGGPEQLVFPVSEAKTHLVQVGSVPGSGDLEGSFTLLADAQQPSHDLFAFARTIDEGPYRDLDVDSIDARREPGEPTAS